jgi:segregation and condensation protein B
MERDLVRIVGRSDELGRPFLYGTTRRFLEVFGLRHLDQLPRAGLAKPDNESRDRQGDGTAETSSSGGTDVIQPELTRYTERGVQRED